MHKEQSNISCRIFTQQEPAVLRITAEINKARGAREKSWWAEELLKEVKGLLDCPSHDSAKPDCVNCRTICQLRSRTANLVLKAGKLFA